MDIPVDPEAYSDESKRSVGIEFVGDYYEDRKYHCKKCGIEAIFSAEQQQKSFEVRKEYMWQRRTLCNDCWHEMRRIKEELNVTETDYCQNKIERLGDVVFLTKWLNLLSIYPTYGKRGNPSRIRFIKRYL